MSNSLSNKVLQEYQEMGFAKTASRHVLGSMNEMAFEYEYFILQRYEGIERTWILAVNKDINRSLMRGSRHLPSH